MEGVKAKKHPSLKTILICELGKENEPVDSEENITVERGYCHFVSRD